ncbi:MAG: hypothetical protein ACLQMF_09925 [Rectinemataceae bacterium]
MRAAAYASRAVALVALLLSSCAAPLLVEKSVDPLRLLGPGELAYLRMDGATARLLAPALLPAAEGRALAPLLERTTTLALGLGPRAGAGPAFDAVFLGSYPYRRAALALGGNSAWKREAQGYYDAEQGIHVSLPGPSLVLATTGRLEPLLALAKEPGSEPLPPRFASAGGAGLLLWIPEPFSHLAEELFGLSMNVPVRGLLIVAVPAPAALSYELSAVFLMDDADAARVYRPLLRLAWYGLAKYLLADDAGALLGAGFSQEGDTYASEPIELSGSSLAAALARLGGFGAGE